MFGGKWRPGDTRRRTLRCVCRYAIMGWIGALQSLAKPIIVPLLTNEKCRLNRFNQTILAAWISMSVMTSEFSDERLVACSPSNRSWLLHNRTAPDTWRSWAIPYATKLSSSTPVVWSRMAGHIPGAGLVDLSARTKYRPNTHATTSVVGEFCFHAFGSENTGVLDKWNPGPHFQRIWPIVREDIAWPPRLATTEYNISGLNRAFARWVQNRLYGLPSNLILQY
jgi:hypothetical protein